MEHPNPDGRTFSDIVLSLIVGVDLGALTFMLFMQIMNPQPLSWWLYELFNG